MVSSFIHCPRKGSVWGFTPTGPFYCAMRWMVDFLTGIEVMARGGALSAVVVIFAAILVGGCRSSNEAIRLSQNSTQSARAFPPVQSAPGAAPAAPEARQQEEQLQTSAPPSADVAAAAPRVATPFPGIRVHINGKRVELDGRTCYDVTWLEFIACSPNTKEHESLVVLPQRPSDIHASMLLAGFEPGEPGRWTYENEKFHLIPPTGSKLRIDVRYKNKAGEMVTESVCHWIRDHLSKHTFPCEPWVFAGSVIAENPEFMGEGEHYVADMTGSVIGLATFSDEVIGYSTVISPEAEIQPPEWEANTRAMPEGGSEVTVVVTEWGEGESDLK